MIDLLNLIKLIIGICPHTHFTRPWRNPVDGKDYVTCLDCGREIVSPIQFGKEKT